MNNQVYVMGFTDKEMTLLRTALAVAGFSNEQHTNDYWALFKRVCITQEFGNDEGTIEALEGVR